MKRTLFLASSITICIIALIILYKYQQTNTVETLTIGMMSGYPPFMTINPTGDFEGFDVAVAQEIAQRLNKKLVIKDMSLASLLLALQQNKIDLVLSGLSITKTRQEKMAMIHYYGKPRLVGNLVFWNSAPAISNIEDLKSYPTAVIAVEPGSWQEDFLVQYPFLQLKNLSAMSEIIMDLKYGKSFAAFLDPDIVPSLQKQYPELKVVEIPLTDAHTSAGCGIAINKDNKELVTAVNRIITELKQDGTLKRLETKWFKE